MPANLALSECTNRVEDETTLPRAMLQCLVTKQEIVCQVIDGRLGLMEAAIRFQALHHIAAVCIERATGYASRATSIENSCRTLIGWVCLSLDHRPEEADRVSARLERELQRQLQTKSTAKQLAAP